MAIDVESVLTYGRCVDHVYIYDQATKEDTWEGDKGDVNWLLGSEVLIR